MSKQEVLLSHEMNELLEWVSKNRGITKEQALKNAFALLQVSEEQRLKGNTLAVIQERLNSKNIVAILK